MHTYIHAYIHTHTYIHTYTSMHIYIIYTHAYTIYVHAYIHTYINSFSYLQKQNIRRIQLQILCVYTQTYTYIHQHIFIPAGK